MKPITYFVETPAVHRLAHQWGDYLGLLSVSDRLALVVGLSQCLYQLRGLGLPSSDLLGCCGDHPFGDTTDEQGELEDLICELDSQLSCEGAAQLIAAILQTVQPTEPSTALQYR